MELVIKTGTKYQKIKLKDRKKGRVLEEESRKKFTIALVLIFSALLLVKKTCINTRPPSPPPHQKKNGKAMFITNHDLFTHVFRTSGGLLVFTMTIVLFFPTAF